MRPLRHSNEHSDVFAVLLPFFVPKTFVVQLIDRLNRLAVLGAEREVEREVERVRVKEEGAEEEEEEKDYAVTTPITSATTFAAT